MSITNTRLFRQLRIPIWGGAAFLLLLPAVAMQFTAEVDWGAEDFLVMGVLLLVCCAGFEVAGRMARNPAYLLAAMMAIGGCFLLMWMNLAVGIIGSEDDPANLLFAGVFVTAIAGALVSLLQPVGLARTMYATAAVQAAIGVYAALGLHLEAVFACMFFAALWLASGRLFQLAARQERAAA